MDEIKILRTSDLNLASVLLSIGFDVIGIDTKSGGPASKMFMFKDTPELKTVMAEYVARQLQIEPNGLFYSRKQLLRKIHNEKEDIKK